MKNRLILSCCAAVAAAAPLAASAKDMTVSHGYTPSHVYAVHGFDPFVACLQESFGSEMGFTIYPSGQIASTKDSMVALQDGLVDIAPIALSYDAAKLPINGLISLPEFANSTENMAGLYRRALDTPEFQGEFTSQGLKPLFILSFPVFQISTTRPPITDLAGFKGLLIRSPGGIGNLTLAALGAVPTEMPAADSFIAVERGTVNGTYSALESIKPYGLHEILKSVSTNAPFGSIPTIATMDLKEWEALDAPAQEKITACSLKVEADLARHLDEQDKALQDEFAGMGIEVYALDEALLSEVKGALSRVKDDYLARMGGRNENIPAAYDSLVALRDSGS